MLKLRKDGYVYVSEKTGKEYDLLSGESIGANTTSDICFIIDWNLIEEGGNGNVKIVNFFFGSSNFETDLTKTENIIKEYVDEYESQQNYKFTTKGIENFYNSSVGYVTDGIDKEKTDGLDIYIRVGNHHIPVPSLADNMESLYGFLQECRENTLDLICEEEK